MTKKQHFVLTAIGKDRPGIVSAVAKILYHNSCNIEDSSMTILGGEFAVIMIVSAWRSLSQKSLDSQFKNVEKKFALNIQCKELKLPSKKLSSGSGKRNPHIISLLGADKPGLVYRVAHLLAKKKVNITDVNTKVVGSDKKPAYAMLIEVDLSTRISLAGLKNELSRLGRELEANITIKPVDVFQL